MTSSTSSQVITEYGKQNIFGRETQPQLVEDYTSYPEEAEKMIAESSMNDEALTYLRRKVAESNQDLAILYLIH